MFYKSWHYDIILLMQFNNRLMMRHNKIPRRNTTSRDKLSHSTQDRPCNKLHVSATTLKAINRGLHALDPATDLLRMDLLVYLRTNQSESWYLPVSKQLSEPKSVEVTQRNEGTKNLTRNFGRLTTSEFVHFSLNLLPHFSARVQPISILTTVLNSGRHELLVC